MAQAAVLIKIKYAHVVVARATFLTKNKCHDGIICEVQQQWAPVVKKLQCGV